MSEEGSRAQSSHVNKTLEANVKNSNQPLRRKYNNIPTGNNTRRIGDELRRIGK